MLNPAAAQFIPGKYDDNGKWMDGWETRRRRGPGHDWCIVRLARPGRISGFDFDTSHFTGNFPPAIAIEACYVEDGDPTDGTVWDPFVPSVAVSGNQHHFAASASDRPVSHLRVNLYPDGGLARIRVYGVPIFTYSKGLAREDGLVDLASAFNGARAIVANNEHYGMIGNLLMPGRGVDMGDGWETRRRREPGNDWCPRRARLAGRHRSRRDRHRPLSKVIFRTVCSLQAARVQGGTDSSLVTQAMFWPVLLDEQKLEADAVHHFATRAAKAGCRLSCPFEHFSRWRHLARPPLGSPGVILKPELLTREAVRSVRRRDPRGRSRAALSHQRRDDGALPRSGERRCLVRRRARHRQHLSRTATAATFFAHHDGAPSARQSGVASRCRNGPT